MSILHKNITDPDLHEPKGCSSAQNGTVYIANGTGSGAWQKASNSGELYIASLKTILLNAAVDSTLNTATDYVKLNGTTFWSNGISDGIGLDSTNGNLVIQRAGNYDLSFWVSHYINGSVNRNIAFKYAINGVVSTRKVITTSSFSGDMHSVGANGFIQGLNVGDTISIYVACTGAVTLSVTDATILARGRFS